VARYVRSRSPAIARPPDPADILRSLRYPIDLANSLNIPSVNAAIRLGLTNETPGDRGGIKGHRLLLPGKPGSLPGREGDAGYIASEGENENAKGNWSRSTTLLGITYDEWFEGGVKERLKGMLVRK
jgi:hypothetical protein